MPLSLVTLMIPYGSTDWPLSDTSAKARVMSSTRTSDVPSTIDGYVEIAVEMPKRRAIEATEPKPTSLPSSAATVFFE